MGHHGVDPGSIPGVGVGLTCLFRISEVKTVCKAMSNYPTNVMAENWVLYDLVTKGL